MDFSRIAEIGGPTVAVAVVALFLGWKTQQAIVNHLLSALNENTSAIRELRDVIEELRRNIRNVSQ